VRSCFRLFRQDGIKPVSLGRDKLRDVAQMTGSAETFAVGKLWCREVILKNFLGESLMRDHSGRCGIVPHRHQPHRQYADIDT
jgi:hypothetical protein